MCHMLNKCIIVQVIVSDVTHLSVVSRMWLKVFDHMNSV